MRHSPGPLPDTRRPRAYRTSVSVEASVVTLNAYQYPELVDISLTGAKVRGDALPQPGATALLRASPLEVLCRVVWVKGDRCGLRFEEPVSKASLKQVQLNSAVLLDPSAPEA